MIMNQSTEWNFTEDEFKAWIKKNGRHLISAGFEVPEIAAMAIHNCHFNPNHVYKILSHFNDAVQGSNIDNRVKMQTDVFEYTIDKMNGKIFLDEYWDELVKKQTEGRDFDE